MFAGVITIKVAGQALGTNPTYNITFDATQLTSVTAVGNRDLGVVQSVAMLIAVVYVMLNLVADLIVLLLVPKLREPA